MPCLAFVSNDMIRKYCTITIMSLTSAFHYSKRHYGKSCHTLFKIADRERMALPRGSLDEYIICVLAPANSIDSKSLFE
jgi:hypothetical protein